MSVEVGGWAQNRNIGEETVKWQPLKIARPKKVRKQDQVNSADSAIIFLINHWSVRLVRMVKLVQDVQIVQVVQVVQVV